MSPVDEGVGGGTRYVLELLSVASSPFDFLSRLHELDGSVVLFVVVDAIAFSELVDLLLEVCDLVLAERPEQRQSSIGV